jgi:hypothetical protein
MQHNLKLQYISFLPKYIQRISFGVLLHASRMQKRVSNSLTYI